APCVEHGADRDRGQRRSDREEHPRASPARVVEAAPEPGGRRVQRRQEGGVVEQENLGKGRTALEADLLAGVGALGLADVPKRPPQACAVAKGDLEPARRQADRRLSARSAAAVEVVARERAGHFESATRTRRPRRAGSRARRPWRWPAEAPGRIPRGRAGPRPRGPGTPKPHPGTDPTG